MADEVQTISTENKVKKDKDEIQITVSLECETKLSELVDKLNSEFDLGRITRKHVAVYLLEQGVLKFSDADAQAIKYSILTDVMLLEYMYKQAKDSGVVPDALKEILWKSMNLTSSSKKTKKSISSKYSNAILENKEAA